MVSTVLQDDGTIHAVIPNSLLQTAGNLYIWIYDEHLTKCKFKMKVLGRPKPADYTLEVTDNEVYSFNDMYHEMDVRYINQRNEYMKLIKELMADVKKLKEAYVIVDGGNPAD